MRIGLVRHFEVNCPHKWFLFDEEFQEWVRQYDCSPIRMLDMLDMPVEKYKWEKCYSSNLPRAIEKTFDVDDLISHLSNLVISKLKNYMVSMDLLIHFREVIIRNHQLKPVWN